MIVRQSLLELLSIQMGCEYLSDLRFLTIPQKNYLARTLKPLSPKREDLRDWNEALTYLTGAPEEKTALAAKERLIELLTAEKQRDRTLRREPTGERK